MLNTEDFVKAVVDDDFNSKMKIGEAYYSLLERNVYGEDTINRLTNGIDKLYTAKSISNLDEVMNYIKDFYVAVDNGTIKTNKSGVLSRPSVETYIRLVPLPEQLSFDIDYEEFICNYFNQSFSSYAIRRSDFDEDNLERVSYKIANSILAHKTSDMYQFYLTNDKMRVLNKLAYDAANKFRYDIKPFENLGFSSKHNGTLLLYDTKHESCRNLTKDELERIIVLVHQIDAAVLEASEKYDPNLLY